MKNLKKLVSSFFCSLTLAVTLSPFSSQAISKPQLDYYNASSGYSKALEPKNQQISGPCWAFAAMATLEGYLSKNNLLKESLSEKHLLNWANHKNEPGWKINISDGASHKTSCGYLTSGEGPVLNKHCPYNCSNGYWESNNSITPSFSVRGIKFLHGEDKNEIKESIIKYGAVYACTTNHAFSIIGWNGNASCWITKDSSSNKFNTFSTVPFSTKLDQLYCITNAKKYDDKEKIYQHDKFGANASYSVSSGNLTVANVFDISAGEILDSVMVESTSEGAYIKIYYSEILQDGTPNNNKNTWKELYDGEIPYNGYHTYSLSKKIKNVENNKIAIIACITPNKGKASIGSQSSSKTLDVKKPSKTSFQFINYNFEEIDDSLSIKAITKK